MADLVYSRYYMQERMKFVVFLTLGIFLLELAPRNLKLSEVEFVLIKLEGGEDLHELHVWSTSSENLALSCHVMIKDQSTHSAQNILNQIQSPLKEKFGIEHTSIQLECGYCVTQRFLKKCASKGTNPAEGGAIVCAQFIPLLAVSRQRR